MTERELVQYKMTQKEQETWDSFCQIICDKCSLMDTPPMDWNILEQYLMVRLPFYGARGYSEEDGYYDVQEGDRGELHVVMCTPSLKEAVLEKLLKVAHDMSYSYVIRNRKEIDAVQQKEWRFHKEYGPMKEGKCEIRIIKNNSWKYDTEYDYRKYWFELALSFLGKVLDCEALDLQIARYEGLMNYHFQKKFWSYDLREREFIKNTDF